jgi:hypothetical protein
MVTFFDLSSKFVARLNSKQLINNIRTFTSCLRRRLDMNMSVSHCYGSRNK